MLPSAVCVSEMPSLALRMAAEMPRIEAVMRVLMARPAASSLAELMRVPLDKRSIEVDMFRPFMRNEFCACRALMLVLIATMKELLKRFAIWTRNVIEILLVNESDCF